MNKTRKCPKCNDKLYYFEIQWQKGIDKHWGHKYDLFDLLHNKKTICDYKIEVTNQ